MIKISDRQQNNETEDVMKVLSIEETNQSYCLLHHHRRNSDQKRLSAEFD